MAGQKVLNSDKKQIDISSLPKGTYILKTTIEGKDITKKVIKKLANASFFYLFICFRILNVFLSV